MFKSEYQSERPEEVADDVYWKGFENLEARRTEDFKAAKAYYDGIQRLRYEYLEGLHSMIGEDNLKKYLTLHKKRIEKIRSANRKLPQTPEGMKKREEIRLKAVEESKKLISRSGVDISVLKTLRDTYREKASELFSQTIGKGEITEERSRSKNTDFFPPYNGGWGYLWNYYASGGLPTPSFGMHLSNVTGDIGSHSYIEVSGADDSDSAWALIQTAVGVWYMVPNTGQLIVKAELEVVNGGPIWGHTYNECGYSDVVVEGVCRFYAHFTSPFNSPKVYGYAPLGYYVDDKETHWLRPGYPAGMKLYCELIIPDVITAGSWARVWFGIHTYNHFWSNDYTVTSGLHQRYLVRKIGVTTTT